MFIRFKTKLYLPLLLLPIISFCQDLTQIREPLDQWPPIALINKVWYKDGSQYIDTSYKYAGTGFLVDTGKDTLAVTAKHVLWIANNRKIQAVDLKDELDRWVMHPKGNPVDSVLIGELINRDTAEMLHGPESTITQRDWLVFSTRYVSSRIQALKPRFTPVQKGEPVWWTGCPYRDSAAVVFNAQVLEVEGNRIVFSKPPDANVNGASGSPLIDQHGFLIGILCGATRSRTSGESALYGLSTHYLGKVLKDQRPYNQPLISITDVLQTVIEEKGVQYAWKKYKDIQNDANRYFVYDFTVERINQLASSYRDKGDDNTAMHLLQISKREFALADTCNQIARIYLSRHKRLPAIRYYRKALQLDPDNKEAQAGLRTLSW